MDWPSINENAASVLKSEWLGRVRASMHKSSFVRIKGISRLMRLWGEWGDLEEVRNWLGDCPKVELAPLLESMASTSTSSSGYQLKSTRWLSWKFLERYGDKDFWASVLTEFEERTELPELGSAALLLRESLERWEQGKDDSDSWSFREDEEQD